MNGLEVIDNTMKRYVLDCDDLVRRYIAGESEFAIALSLNIARATVRKRLKEAGIVPRNASAAGYVRASRLSAAERQAHAAAAHVAATGRQKTFAEMCLTARTRQKRRVHTSTYERILEDLLAERGIATVPQCAIGPYNCDLGAYPVAVEIFGGHWHWYGYHLRVAEKRLNYLLNAGWHVLAILAKKEFPITSATAEYVAAYIEAARSDPARRREYRVVRGAGELMAAGSVDDEKISIIPTFTNGRNALGQYTQVPR